ncbi:uncharacterized protein LOC110269195 [Arachis ipaensis]|uniref:uncharacterized protein LOC110269195 n=1 Tax=Arachis ipaensis TaxID=130454 RepID=UPI000A2B0CE1|nr:uncharacterized protein LOC110269195 [Arachis ipaensis]
MNNTPLSLSLAKLKGHVERERHCTGSLARRRTIQGERHCRIKGNGSQVASWDHHSSQGATLRRDGTFKAGCRPFIVLDGTFLKGYFGGQLLTAVGQDANNQLFPIAYGVVDAETRENWRFFLEELHTDIGDYNENGWVFMFDQQKGLIPALQDVMPGVKHRFCCMHMWRNLNKRWKDKELKGAFWQYAKATTDQEFKDAMANVKRINKQAWEYLDKFEQEQWSRSKFSEWPKVDSLTSNNCESFNSTIVGLREKSILTMLEELRFYIMKTMATHKDALMAYTGHIAPIQVSRLEKEKNKLTTGRHSGVVMMNITNLKSESGNIESG